MKRHKVEPVGPRRFRLSCFLLVLATLYLVFIAFKFPQLLEIASGFSGDDSYVFAKVGVHDEDVRKGSAISMYKDFHHRKLEDNVNQDVELMLLEHQRLGSQSLKPFRYRYGRIANDSSMERNDSIELSVLEKMADEAWTLGSKAWEEIENTDFADISDKIVLDGKPESCPSWLAMSGEDLVSQANITFLPCGLIAGSSITVVGTPHYAHREYVPQLAKFRNGNPLVMVSQFSVELQGLKSVEGEAPPKILHLNPRLRGDWSRRAVIEHNTCYRMQWGKSHRCDGSPSTRDEDLLIDGYRRCEKWMSSDVVDPKESKTTSWLKRFIGRKHKPELLWPYPFAEGKMFILTIRAGIEGYHINVGGRHVTSFPYRMGFTLEDATGLAVQGDVDVHSIYVTSLPSTHPSFSPQRVLEMSEKWKAFPLNKKPIKLFVGVLSATNHFAERMAVRKTWMQSLEINSSKVAVRFFVALSQRKEVNAILKKEAAYFGDIVILPFLDRYELVVLKTIAICEYGVQNVTAEYIMKCDDDTFVRFNTVLQQIQAFSPEKSLYMGNLNLLHRPLRRGKWAVTYEEWPEEVYPPYANGPAYIISSDIARFIGDQHTNQRLKLFKMEDVSMGMWVQQFNSSRRVQYSHNWKFCQYGCMQGYYTAHYQSPRQMLCLWDNLAKGRPNCCNF
ncbi:hydroxyproline O-galactosyltransferase GALT2 isoform X1 [Amaranthus tricolor]|uniref:hydroxyproline O-galactosyltransferase GALT2 isoform X1 n=1 Tax=Amaranthus tricolor TaxID=29722 RepID=UPI00258ECBD0|nr:hydroxyproline O-galactosyltransferase GALT2 isoform X1 [Amaranthus tricolor]